MKKFVTAKSKTRCIAFDLQCNILLISIKCHDAKTKCVRDFAYLPSVPRPGWGLFAVVGTWVRVGVVGVGAGGERGPRGPLVLQVCYISRRGCLNTREWLKHCWIPKAARWKHNTRDKGAVKCDVSLYLHSLFTFI